MPLIRNSKVHIALHVILIVVAAIISILRKIVEKKSREV
jgi:hypothetical protein